MLPLDKVGTCDDRSEMRGLTDSEIRSMMSSGDDRPSDTDLENDGSSQVGNAS